MKEHHRENRPKSCRRRLPNQLRRLLLSSFRSPPPSTGADSQLAYRRRMLCNRTDGNGRKQEPACAQHAAAYPEIIDRVGLFASLATGSESRGENHLRELLRGTCAQILAG